MVVQKKGYMYAMIYVLGNTGALPRAMSSRRLSPTAQELELWHGWPLVLPRTRARSSLACGLLAPGDKAL